MWYAVHVSPTSSTATKHKTLKAARAKARRQANKFNTAFNIYVVDMLGVSRIKDVIVPDKSDNPGQLQIVVPKGTPVKLLNAPKGTRISRKTIEAEVTVRSKTRTKRRTVKRENAPSRSAGRWGVGYNQEYGIFPTKTAAKKWIRENKPNAKVIPLYQYFKGNKTRGMEPRWTLVEYYGTDYRRNPGKRNATKKAFSTRYGVYVGTTLAYVSTKKIDANKAASKLRLSGRVGIKIKQVKPNPISGKLPKIGWREQYKKAAYATTKAPAKRRKQAKTTAKIRRTFARRSR